MSTEYVHGIHSHTHTYKFQQRICTHARTYTCRQSYLQTDRLIHIPTHVDKYLQTGRHTHTYIHINRVSARTCVNRVSADIHTHTSINRVFADIHTHTSVNRVSADTHTSHNRVSANIYTRMRVHKSTEFADIHTIVNRVLVRARARTHTHVNMLSADTYMSSAKTYTHVI